MEQEKEGISYHLNFEVVICEFGEEVIASLGFLSFLDILQSIHSWVDDVEPKGWNRAQHETMEILKWVVRGIIKSS